MEIQGSNKKPVAARHENVEMMDEEAKKVRFFRGECPHCEREVGLPVLGSFTYGEFIFQTRDASTFAYCSAPGHPAWERVKAIFQSSSDLRLGTDHVSAELLQKTMALCADPLGGKSFSIDFPLCTECGKKIDDFQSDEILHDSEIPSMSWKGFLGLAPEEQTATVLAAIDEIGASGG